MDITTFLLALLALFGWGFGSFLAKLEPIR